MLSGEGSRDIRVCLEVATLRAPEGTNIVAPLGEGCVLRKFVKPLHPADCMEMQNHHGRNANISKLVATSQLST